MLYILVENVPFPLHFLRANGNPLGIHHNPSNATILVHKWMYLTYHEHHEDSFSKCVFPALLFSVLNIPGCLWSRACEYSSRAIIG